MENFPTLILLLFFFILNYTNWFDNIYGLGKTLEAVIWGPEKMNAGRKFGVESLSETLLSHFM